MKRFYAGLTFLCFYFLVPALAQAQSVSSLAAHDSGVRAVTGLSDKPAACWPVQPAACVKRTLLASGDAPKFFSAALTPAELQLEIVVFGISTRADACVSRLDCKHALRTGLSPPSLS